MKDYSQMTIEELNQMSYKEKCEYICQCLDPKVFGGILRRSEIRKAERESLQRQKAG